MKRFIFIAAFTIAVFAAKAQDNSKTEADIRSLEQTVVNAILRADTISLKKLWAPEFMVNNPRNNISENLDAVLAVQKAGMIDYSIFERVIERMQFQKDMVITMGREKFASRSDMPGVKAGVEYKRRFTNIWMKKKGGWQQVGRHASIICQ
ncbi:MAG TPA: nuclear transport factor 2 family protein [Ferruginibacter sp.]|nr:nuclear transport factor 2 family protein [Ferruginibacter sp.]